jgi:hypothetical protein
MKATDEQILMLLRRLDQIDRESVLRPGITSPYIASRRDQLQDAVALWLEGIEGERASLGETAEQKKGIADDAPLRQS